MIQSFLCIPHIPVGHAGGRATQEQLPRTQMTQIWRINADRIQYWTGSQAPASRLAKLELGNQQTLSKNDHDRRYSLATTFP